MFSDIPWVEFANVPLADELIEKINGYLDVTGQVVFSRACKGVNRLKLFKNSVDQATIPAQLLKYFVLSGMKEDACKLIEALPHLFFIKTAAVHDLARDHRGNRRQVPGSAFQAALAMGYTNLLGLKAVQEVIKANPKTVASQTKEQFPDGFDYPIANEKEIDQAFASFAEAISADKFCKWNESKKQFTKTVNQATQEATDKFREVFELTLSSKGWLFDLRILDKAIQALCANCRLSWDWSHASWFVRQGFGYLQMLVSTFDAQVMIRGIKRVIDDGETDHLMQRLLIQSLDYYIGPGVQGGTWLSCDSFIGLRSGALESTALDRGILMTDRGLLLKYIALKNQRLNDLISDQANRPSNTL